MPFRAAAAVAPLLPLVRSCAHLAQPRSYTTDTRSVDRMQREPLRAESAVRIRRWPACSTMEAEIEPAGSAAAGMPLVLKVPVAPPGLFAPAASGATTETRYES